MSKQSVLIYKIPELFKILNELKIHLDFEVLSFSEKDKLLEFKNEDAAARKASYDILSKMMKLESASMPPEDRKEISSNLKKAVKKAERIVSKIDK